MKIDLNEKQNIVDLLFKMQTGRVSTRRMASEIMDAHEKAMKHVGAERCENCYEWSCDGAMDADDNVFLCKECGRAFEEETRPTQ